MEGWGFCIIVGVAIVLLIILIFGASHLASSRKEKRQEIWPTAKATILDIHTGTNENSRYLKLILDVQPDDLDHYLSWAGAMLPIGDPSFYLTGMVIDVKYDPENPKDVVLARSMDEEVAYRESKQTSEIVSSIAHTQQYGNELTDEPSKKLSTLKEMFDKGLINEKEYQEKKAEILSRM